MRRDKESPSYCISSTCVPSTSHCQSSCHRYTSSPCVLVPSYSQASCWLYVYRCLVSMIHESNSSGRASSSSPPKHRRRPVLTASDTPLPAAALGTCTVSTDGRVSERCVPPAPLLMPSIFHVNSPLTPNKCVPCAFTLSARRFLRTPSRSAQAGSGSPARRVPAAGTAERLRAHENHRHVTTMLLS